MPIEEIQKRFDLEVELDIHGNDQLIVCTGSDEELRKLQKMLDECGYPNDNGRVSVTAGFMTPGVPDVYGTIMISEGPKTDSGYIIFPPTAYLAECLTFTGEAA